MDPSPLGYRSCEVVPEGQSVPVVIDGQTRRQDRCLRYPTAASGGAAGWGMTHRTVKSGPG